MNLIELAKSNKKVEFENPKIKKAFDILQNTERRIKQRHKLLDKIRQETITEMAVYDKMAEKLGVSWFDVRDWIHLYKEIRREPEPMDWWGEYINGGQDA